MLVDNIEVQTHLGANPSTGWDGWKLENWDFKTCSVQLGNINGLYCIKNIINDKMLIGEGKIHRRLNMHVRGDSCNKTWKKDLEQYGKENFRLIWIIEEENEIQRKLIENKLQLHFKDNCYNLLRRQYPTQLQLISNLPSKYSKNKKNISERLQNYTKIKK